MQTAPLYTVWDSCIPALFSPSPFYCNYVQHTEQGREWLGRVLTISRCDHLQGVQLHRHLERQCQNQLLVTVALQVAASRLEGVAKGMRVTLIQTLAARVIDERVEAHLKEERKRGNIFRAFLGILIWEFYKLTLKKYFIKTIELLLPPLLTCPCTVTLLLVAPSPPSLLPSSTSPPWLRCCMMPASSACASAPSTYKKDLETNICMSLLSVHTHSSW